ncbi:hypothetical protein [Ekhidna sp.]
MKKLEPILLIFFGILISCDADNPINRSGIVTDFPLEEGNLWVYNWSTDDQDFPENLRNRTIRIIITGKDEINGVETFRFETTADEEPELTSIHHYRQDSNKLSLMAYKIYAINDANARTSNPRLNDSLGLTDDGIISGDLVIEEPPRIVYDYPLEIGKSWTHWEKDGSELITKQATKLEDVSVPAGTFKAYKVENDGAWYESNGIETTEFVSNIGLIKRTISFDQTLTDEQGNIISEKRVNITVELKEFSE